MLTGTFAARRGDLALVLRWAAAAFVAFAIAGLVTRLWPATFPISGGVLPERVAFPLTYWNAMGIACALGVVLTLHLTASGAEPRVVRVLAAAALAPVAVTLYFTFSRGAIWVLPVGVVLYALLAQPRGLVTALSAAIPAAIAVKVAYDADLLARIGFDSPAAAGQGRHVGVVVVVCSVAATAARAAVLPLDTRLERVRLPPRAREALAASVIVALLGGALVAGAPHRIAEARKTFTEGRYYYGTSDLRTRLTSAVDNGRIGNWRVALDGFDSSPLHGTGAGTYRLTWELHRPAPPVQMTDGHSLYLETLSELGLPGLVLLLVVLGTLLIGGLRRLGGPERHAHGAFVAAGAMLALHAGVDWDWEMPALLVWLFGAGGVVLAARQGSERWGEISRTPRIVAALAVLVLALTPALMWLSQGPLERASQAFASNDCPTAIDASLDAIGRFGVRPEPWEVLAYCDARAGQYALATRAVGAARSRDPHNWRYAYGQAIVDGVSGRDPRPAAREALRLDPLEPLARTLVRDLDRARGPARRREVARRAGIPFG
ncbi:O-antigen ligase family protein [Candidatus Solirubrobacter pratensis]|uniref:O-antigen ligase family protein n=1 Tax=Candidatus Solirubrobacter pratensis TaxID=1298857 RepID=UPI000481C102|nr:O-antigen ligase family protein [Candidatus Solirubrobacter pratensis]